MTKQQQKYEELLKKYQDLLVRNHRTNLALDQLNEFSEKLCQKNNNQ